jgi:hypothetical protein
VGRIPPQELVDRYCEANRVLIQGPVNARDAALVGFIRRHPWSAPFLDAACGLLRPNGLLRRKMLIMAAVLEASPEFAEEFLPRTAHPVRAIVIVAGQGLLGLVRALAGMLVYPLAVRS